MGTGIMAAIPLVLRQQEHQKYDSKYFSQKFFDCFSKEKIENKKLFILKEDLLINNYKSFLTEFYDLIEEDINEERELTPNIIPNANNLDEFLEMFGSKNRNNCAPFIYERSSTFSVLGCKCEQYWLFYNGSYKAYLEEYSTLLHFEKILAKAMKNPLANAIKFGIFG